MEDYRNLDVLIVGAGVTGSSIARELARTDLKTAVLEKELDVCEGTSKANSGIAHAGYDAKPGTLKARLNVRGSEMMPQLSEELGFDYFNNGSLVLCFDEEHRPAITELYEKGQANGVQGLQILEREAILEMEPHVNPDVVCALYAPTAGIVDPFGLNVAMAENAADNGVEFIFGEPVETIEKTENGWLVNNKYQTKVLINAAGVFADKIHNMSGAKPMHIRPRKGEYFLLTRRPAAWPATCCSRLPPVKARACWCHPPAMATCWWAPPQTLLKTRMV